MVDTVKFGKMLNNFGRHCTLEGAFKYSSFFSFFSFPLFFNHQLNKIIINSHVTNLCREDFFHGDIDGAGASVCCDCG